MTNSIEFLNKTTRNTKLLWRLADQPCKVRKHRYTRKKVRSFFGLGDCNEDDSN